MAENGNLQMKNCDSLLIYARCVLVRIASLKLTLYPDVVLYVAWVAASFCTVSLSVLLDDI